MFLHRKETHFNLTSISRWIKLQRMDYLIQLYVIQLHISLNIFLSIILFLCIILFLLFYFFKILFLSNLYTQCGAWTHNPESKNRMLYWLSQPVAPKYNFKFWFTSLFSKHFSVYFVSFTVLNAEDKTLKKGEKYILEGLSGIYHK